MGTVALALAKIGLVSHDLAERRYHEMAKRRTLLHRLEYRADVLALQGDNMRLESVERRIKRLKRSV